MSKASSHMFLSLLRRVADDQRSDGQLLQAFCEQGDEACFHALLRRHGPMVLSLCRAMLPGDADMEDAFQATFLVLARKAASIRKQASLASWLHGVAYRTSLRARAQAAARRLHERQAATHESAPPVDLAWADFRRVLHEELDRLRERHRAPLVLCYLQGETQDEAARRLGLPKGTLKGRLERARELLRARLVKRGIGPAALLAAASMPLAAQASLPQATLSATAKVASLAAMGSQLAGVVSEPVLRLMEGVLQAMFIAKIRVASLGMFVGAVVLGFTVFAAGQTLGPNADAPAKQAFKAGFGKAQWQPLSPDALAAHLGVTHKSFELSFDPAPSELELSIDIYENGKLAKQGEKVASLPQTKKHACSVLFSHTPGHPKLVLTVVTPRGTFHTEIDDPFAGPGQIFPGPVLDANGRIPLALRPGPGTKSVNDVTLANAEKAVVVQVHRK